MVVEKYNQNPNVFRPCRDRDTTKSDWEENVVDSIDKREIFDIIKSITDPEHPLTLEQLHVVEEDLIKIDNEKNTIDIYFTPTIPHCSLATIIGLSLRIKLIRSLPTRFKVSVEITPDTHVSRTGINKQLADKERIAAAIESGYLSEVINECISIPYEQTKLPSLHKLIKVDSELRTLILNTAITK